MEHTDMSEDKVREVRGTVTYILKRLAEVSDEDFPAYANLLNSLLSPKSRKKMIMWIMEAGITEIGFEEFRKRHHVEMTKLIKFETSFLGTMLRKWNGLKPFSMKESYTIAEVKR